MIEKIKNASDIDSLSENDMLNLVSDIKNLPEEEKIKILFKYLMDDYKISPNIKKFFNLFREDLLKIREVNNTK